MSGVFVLRNWLWISIVLGIITLFLGYKASRVELSYESPKILPRSDSTLLAYEAFRKTFGEDGNVVILGLQDKALFTASRFKRWDSLGKALSQYDGIIKVLSIADLPVLEFNDTLKSFYFRPAIGSSSQDGLDSLKKRIGLLPFYEGMVYNEKTHTTLMAVLLEPGNINSEERVRIVEQIKDEVSAFENKYNTDLHISGLPYIRTEFKNKIGNEMMLFLLLAVLVTAGILYLFFRSFHTVWLSVSVVLIGVVWSLGTMAIFGYKITVLSGLIPPLIIVIGIPNCIFLINQYQSELKQGSNKLRAILNAIRTTGLSLFLANVTTAIGFGVFYFTKSPILVEFGIVAALNVMAAYLITLALIPITLMFLPAAGMRKKGQDFYQERIKQALSFINHLVQAKRKAIYLIITLLTLISAYGMMHIRVIGHIVDDLPKRDPVYTDLQFFEEHFKGVFPFEISIDTQKPNGVLANNGAVLYKINAMQKLLGTYPEFSKPVSLTEALKFAYQAYRGDPKYYVLPPATELQKISPYLSGIKAKENTLNPLMDSTRQLTRISFQIKDIGSEKTEALLGRMQPAVDSIFNPGQYKVTFTGHTLMFLKSNDYLLKNLLESLIIEIILIAIVGLALFRSVSIILLSKLPCLIPLVITAGVMGYLGINFKPSTILIFTIAFGIASDGTIYFLTRYRDEVKVQGKSVPDAVSATITQTGMSMIYTTIVLFCGFAIFTASGFGGTAALGILMSLTLLASLGTNLILLPAILLSLNRK